MFSRRSLQLLRRKKDVKDSGGPGSTPNTAATSLAPTAGGIPDDAQSSAGGSEASTAQQKSGLFPLNKAVTKASQYMVDVIAVHGLGDSPFETWKHSNETIWLQDFLLEDLPGARAFTFGYDSQWIFSRETSLLRDYARTFLEDVRNARRDEEV